MKTFTLFFVLNVIAFSTFSQTPAQIDGDKVEVGVFEHLSDTIPLYLSFRNENDSLVTLRSLINKPTVLSFVYFDCPGLCSPLLDGISDVIEKADLKLGKDYQVITVSFNYHDTPEKARNKKETFLRRHSKSRSAHWMYLTGDSLSIYKLSNSVGFKFKKAGVDFIHPAAIMVLSPQGKITRYLYGISFLPFDLKMAVVESGKGLARPTINRVLEFCFAYDPAGRRYALEITKISGVIIIFLLLMFGAVLLFRKKRTNL